MIEILAGPLVATACAGAGDSTRNWGHLIVAVDPGILVDHDEFIKNVTTPVGRVKNTKKLPDVSDIFVPGERGNRRTNHAIKRPFLSWDKKSLSTRQYQEFLSS